MVSLSGRVLEFKIIIKKGFTDHMEWIELKVTVNQNDADAVANFLIESGSNGIVEDSNPDKKRTILTSYFEKKETFSNLHENIKKYLDELYCLKDHTDSTPPEISIGQIPDEDWNKKWKSFFEPIKITDRLVIKPSWRKYHKKGNEIILELDPGMAFGTGTHASTSMCLQAIEELTKNLTSKEDLAFLDVGTGSGILAIAAVLLGIQKGIAIDIDYQAIQCAIKNAKKNRVAENIDFSTTPIKKIPGDYPLVIANILPHTLIDMKEALCSRLQHDGYLILSGILQTKAETVKEAFCDELESFKEIKKEEWSCLVFKKN
jgi:ribosomal protein L11 methyltransferase